MFTFLTTIVASAALLGQAPPESSWLKSVPAEADIVVHVRSLNAARDDLSAMIKAMSPSLAEQAVPALEQAVDRFTQEMGKRAAETPFLALLRAVAPEGAEGPPFAVIVQSDNYQGVLDSLAGEKAQPKSEGEGVDSFQGRRGETIYATKGPGFVAFGPDRKLVAGIARPGENTLGGRISPEVAQRLLGGDVGVYVNVAALQERYGEVIDQVRQQFMAALDQAGQQAGNAAVMDVAKEIYGGAFDAIKVAQDLAAHVDFDASGLNLSGEVTVKPGSKGAEALARAATGDAADLAKLPAGGSFYVYMNVDPAIFSRFQALGTSILYGGGPPSDELKAAMELQKEVGRVESIGVSSGEKGARRLDVMKAANPRKLVEATTAMMKAMKPAQDAPLNFIKDVSFKPAAQRYRGYDFSEARIVLDLEKLARLQPAPGAADAMRSAFGGDTMLTWFGTDGKLVLSVSAKDWDEARGMIDAYLDGKNPVGDVAGFRGTRAKLPDQVTLLGLLSAQGIVRQVTNQLATMLQNPDLKPPADLPKEPVMLGGSLAAGKAGYQFQLVVPSAAGPVVEKGMGPVIRTIRGQVDQ
jgi:hypothetical protein